MLSIGFAGRYSSPLTPKDAPRQPKDSAFDKYFSGGCWMCPLRPISAPAIGFCYRSI